MIAILYKGISEVMQLKGSSKVSVVDRICPFFNEHLDLEIGLMKQKCIIAVTHVECSHTGIFIFNQLSCTPFVFQSLIQFVLKEAFSDFFLKKYSVKGTHNNPEYSGQNMIISAIK